MSDKRLIKRREFLKMSSATVVAGLTGRLTGKQLTDSAVTIEEAARKVGKAAPAGSWATAGGRSPF